MSEIKEASAERLMLVKGISEADAKAIFEHYHSEN
jgi:ERCC4-type nuclease